MGNPFSCCKRVPYVRISPRITLDEDNEKQNGKKQNGQINRAYLIESLATSVKKDSEGQLFEKLASTQEEQLFYPPGAIRHTNTKEILKYFGNFLCRRCSMLTHLSPLKPVKWITSIDRDLLLVGWQAEESLTSGSVVFLYMLCRDLIPSQLSNKKELKAILLTCLYVSYCYIGHEISYRLEPFLEDTTQEAFWTRSLSILEQMSNKMMRFNTDDNSYNQMFEDLVAEGGQVDNNLLMDGWMSGLPELVATEEGFCRSHYTVYSFAEGLVDYMS